MVKPFLSTDREPLHTVYIKLYDIRKRVDISKFQKVRQQYNNH